MAYLFAVIFSMLFMGALFNCCCCFSICNKRIDKRAYTIDLDGTEYVKGKEITMDELNF